MDKSVLKIWTVGHSTRTIDDFLSLLDANGIEAVADVRSFPGSRRYPHFNAEAQGNFEGKGDGTCTAEKTRG